VIYHSYVSLPEGMFESNMGHICSDHDETASVGLISQRASFERSL
jgi:hypothetical protein